MLNQEHIGAQILLRSRPFPRGAGRLIDKFFSKIAFNEQTTTVRTTDGFSISISPNDLIGRHIYLCKLARPGDVLLDVGANIGYVSACFLTNVPDSQVVAVEPQPAVTALLRQNLSQFGFARHRVVQAAISDQTGLGWIQPCADNPGAGRLVAGEMDGAIAVDLWSPEQVLSFAEVEKLDLVKIDVEGHEEEVIRACLGEFGRLRPRAIVFECGSDKGAPDGSIGSMLRSIGYDIFGVKKRLMKLELPPIQHRVDCMFNDYIAIRQ
jgi:FkbM family methyltransferase